MPVSSEYPSRIKVCCLQNFRLTSANLVRNYKVSNQKKKSERNPNVTMPADTQWWVMFGFLSFQSFLCGGLIRDRKWCQMSLQLCWYNSYKWTSNQALDPHSLPPINIYTLNPQHLPLDDSKSAQNSKSWWFLNKNVLNS